MLLMNEVIPSSQRATASRAQVCATASTSSPGNCLQNHKLRLLRAL